MKTFTAVQNITTLRNSSVQNKRYETLPSNHKSNPRQVQYLYRSGHLLLRKISVLVAGTLVRLIYREQCPR